MNYLKIKNTGEIDPKSLILLGASSKRGDSSKIGMFGSGNKFSLAYLLRNKYEVSIYAGERHIPIELAREDFRDNSYSVVVIDGQKTSITTEFGKDWQLWQAIREIYCNSIDEGGHSLEYVNSISPKAGETHFYIRNRAEIQSFVGKFDEYFSEHKKVLFECGDGKIIEKTGDKMNLYRKGVRCFDTEKNSVFDYDLSEIDIDENRIAKYPWMIPSRIWNLVYQCTDKEVIRQILFASSDPLNFEGQLADYSTPSSSLMGKEYLEVLSEIQIAPKGLSGLLSVEEMASVTVLPSAIFEQAKAKIGNNNLATKFRCYGSGIYVELIPDALTHATVNKALDFFRECEYSGPLNYPIGICRHDDKGILGFADLESQKIWVTELAISKGVQSTIETIIEEYIHLHYNVRDETRGFQDAAITELVQMMKKHKAFLV